MAFSGEQKAFCVLQSPTLLHVTFSCGVLPRDLPELRLRIMDAVATIDVHMLERVW
jgi:hypothetical protein